MSDQILTAIIGGIAGLIGGGIVAIIAPWIKWGIEKRKQKLAYRRELITNWRAMIFNVMSVYEEVGAETFFDLLEKEPHYLSLKPHITTEAFKKLSKADIVPGKIIIVTRGKLGSGSSIINPIGRFISILSSEVDRIEQEWDLLFDKSYQPPNPIGRNFKEKKQLTEDKELKKEFDKIPNVDENGDPIYKIDSDAPTKKLPEIPDDTIEDSLDTSEFKDTPQDLKDETSQECQSRVETEK
jgi:hypothetical protein